jgi:hypothetical protein
MRTHHTAGFQGPQSFESFVVSIAVKVSVYRKPLSSLGGLIQRRPCWGKIPANTSLAVGFLHYLFDVFYGNSIERYFRLEMLR